MTGKRTWTLPKAPLAANRMLRLHWAARRRERAQWAKLLLIAPPWERPREAPQKARLSILVTRRRIQDPDNATASLKPLLDALVARGWLMDDSAEHLELHMAEVAGKPAQTRITWEVVPS